ncbi:uncharacterized protein LOC129589680 [Paramacrobiotus metropolitanus]|uniref:uncharacterized protein LOC129589680 n=1 Tax=Paramacrobiotus metropolitanus TaxID=2943436 RepID=UPI0024461090|nr:uncharacterized protein LOC129589680 [Paramacrobiotus metropolitanus]XP_055340496.1 uncharacterized protein LOC129589680 [Paramacrobiotus metropolitanus]
MGRKYCIFHCVLIVLVLLHSAAAVVDENDEIVITADLFNEPINFFDANVIAKTGPTLWPNRTAIPYVIDSDFEPAEKQTILRALRIMERKTRGCILFTPRVDEIDCIYFITDVWEGTCASKVGKIGGKQYIILARATWRSSSCVDTRSIQHEVMHTLGFHHEHQRPDRDQYVNVRFSNIDMDNYGAEDYPIDATMYTFGTKYDYHSIVHYDAFSGASNKQSPAMIPKHGLIVRMGQKARMSPGDVAKITLAYQCPLNIVAGNREFDEDFPNFSREPMDLDQCAAQFNRYCQSDITTITNCTSRRDFRIVCQSIASVAVLERMALDMAEKPLRLISIYVEEQLITKYSFLPIQRQILHLQLQNCITKNATSRLNKMGFTNLLHFELYHCRKLVIEKTDFASSRQIRIIVFYNTTLGLLEPETFTDLAELQILSLEALLEGQKNYKFGQPFKNFLRNLHCGCDFAWYRSWWRRNKRLRLSVEAGELYSFAGPSTGTLFSSNMFTKDDLYHPVNCQDEPFPLGPAWINYYAQTEYSINEPNCKVGQSSSTGSIGKPATDSKPAAAPIKTPTGSATFIRTTNSIVNT